MKLHADRDQGPDSDHAKTPRQNKDIMVAHLARMFATLGSHDGIVLNLVLQRPPRRWMDTLPERKEVRRAITKLKDGKSWGKDGIPAERCKALATHPTTFEHTCTIMCDYWKSGSSNEPRPPPEPPPARADDRDALVHPGWLVAKLVPRRAIWDHAASGEPCVYLTLAAKSSLPCPHLFGRRRLSVWCSRVATP